MGTEYSASSPERNIESVIYEGEKTVLSEVLLLLISHL
jgi:hypothetical protein